MQLPAKSRSLRGEHLVPVIRQIADVRNRLAAADSEIENVKSSEDYILVKQAKQARSEGRDLISEHVARTEEHITDLKSQIADIKDRLIEVYND